MLKAYVKVNILVHLENEGSADAKEAFGAKYPLAEHRAGTVEVKDISEGERLVGMLNNHLNNTFMQLGILELKGTHKPDLALAFGGDPEPKRPEKPE